MARIEFRNIAKRFGDVEVIAGMDLDIADGEFVALLGPSGCGKSTSLLILAGIYLPSGGDLLFDGHVVNDVEAKDRNVGIVFQSYALYPHMTVRDNIMFPLRFKKTPRDEAIRRVNEAAALVQVGELLDRKPSELSGGQQQRVALARALVKEPQLLLLDEPLSNLDATLRLSMRTEIKSLQDELGVTTILVTHDQIEATTMADRIICMRAGRIEQIGTPDDLYVRPSSLFVAGFIGSPPINLVHGTAANGAVDVAGRSLPGGRRKWRRHHRPAARTPRLRRNGPRRTDRPDRADGARSALCRLHRHRLCPRPRTGLDRRPRHRRGGPCRIRSREIAGLRRGERKTDRRGPCPTTQRDDGDQGVAIDADGRRVLLKWHKLRRAAAEPPFAIANLPAGLALGASMEIDVRLMADGDWICLHDDVLDEETDGAGPVARLDTAAARSLHIAGANYPPPLLTDMTAVLAAAPASDACLQLDLKEPAATPDRGGRRPLRRGDRAGRRSLPAQWHGV